MDDRLLNEILKLQQEFREDIIKLHKSDNKIKYDGRLKELVNLFYDDEYFYFYAFYDVLDDLNIDYNNIESIEENIYLIYCNVCDKITECIAKTLLVDFEAVEPIIHHLEIEEDNLKIIEWIKNELEEIEKEEKLKRKINNIDLE
jgi:predicted amidohydrolase